MALQEVTASFLRRLRTQQPSTTLSQASRLQCIRHASSSSSTQSTAVAQEIQDLEQTDFVKQDPATTEPIKYDPLHRSRSFQGTPPSSRYKFRPPKYYRGPLHPHQPPAPSDPSSREYIPGPFTLPRLQQTYDSTLEPDLMTLAYVHHEPGYVHPVKGERLRSWQGASPYFKNRALRGPRGGDSLRLLRKPITFRNVPRIERVTVHSMVKGAISDSSHLHVAGMVLQAITNVRATAHETKGSVAGFGIRGGQHLSVTCELTGEDMYHFLGKCIDVVMPKIKDWRGVKGSSGDNSGNIGFGFTGEVVGSFPEIEVNYDA